MAGQKRPWWTPLVGTAQLAAGQKAGIEQFGGTAQSYLTSLAPLLALPLAGSLLLMLTGHGLAGLGTLLLTLVAQLAPAVLSEVLATKWGRQAEWLRYVTAFNWCQWTLPVAVFVLWLPLQGLVGQERQAAAVQWLVVLVGLYGLWLNWTVARHGLALGRGRAALLVVLVNLGTAVLLLGPGLVQAAVGGQANGST